jgi:UDP-N-acetylmuramate dehydrogenase
MPSLKSHHTFSLQAECQSIVEFNSADAFLSAYNKADVAYILGEGSNTLFLEDYQGTVFINRIAGINHFDTESHHHISVGAGESWHEFVTLCMHNGWYGLENLALIPGSVGACPIQNIGAYGIEVGKFINSVEAVLLSTGEKIIIKGVECNFAYRDSIFKNELANKVLITQVNFVLPKVYSLETCYGELSKLTAPTAQHIFNAVIEIRKSKLPDPVEFGNAGSFFKNPVISTSHFETLKSTYGNIPGFRVSSDETKVPAAWLIDQAGFKGKVLNQVRCHPTQPLVLTNLGNAKGKDVITLAQAIVRDVSEKFKIQLEPEVRLVGAKGVIDLV